MTSLDALRAALAGTYDIEREIGQGGMARVFLARDRKHERDVALKVLDGDIAAGIGAERFVREIRLAARLSHPHILPLLDSGDVGDQPYYVMPYVAGDSIRDRLSRDGPFPVDEAIAIACEVADALDYAHAAGVIHRDVKPENVLLHGSHAVVLDFGVARAISAATDATANITQAGLAVGTPAYMSPEQAAGEAALDGRSDEYSLAVMLFEMLTGVPVFRASTAQGLIAKRFTETPKPVTVLRPEVPRHAADAIARALSLDTTLRFPTLGEFRRALAGEVTAASLDIAPDGGGLSVAVVPFTNVGGDPANDALAEGLTDDAISALSRLRTLRVAARTSSFAVRGTNEDVAGIGRRLQVDHLVEGSVQRSGQRVRVKARLVRVPDGFQLWAGQFDKEMDDVFAIQDAISAAIVEALNATILADAGVTGAGAVPTNVAAYEKYLEGRFAWNKRTRAGMLRAVEQFEAAVAADPHYAPAYAALAGACATLGVYAMRPPPDVMPLARAQAERALRIDPSLADAHATLGWVAAVYDRDWARSEQAFTRAITLHPAHVAARQWRAISLFVPLGRYVEAIADADRACALDPLSAVVGVTAGAVRAFAGDHDGAARVFRDVLATEPGFGMAHFFTAMSLLATGQADAALAAFTRAGDAMGEAPELRARLAQARALTGDTAGARAGLAELGHLRDAGYASAALVAQVHDALGEVDAALEWLRIAEHEHDPELIYLRHRPVSERLRAHSEFRELVTRLGLPEPPA